MTKQEMEIIERHTIALKANTQAMQQLTRIMERIVNPQFIEKFSDVADGNMTAAKRMQSVANDIEAAAKIMERASYTNIEAANKIIQPK